MRFLDLYISGFGKFHNTSVSFEDGINIVYGMSGSIYPVRGSRPMTLVFATARTAGAIHEGVVLAHPGASSAHRRKEVRSCRYFAGQGI